MAVQPQGCRCYSLLGVCSLRLEEGQMGRNQSEACAGVFRHSESKGIGLNPTNILITAPPVIASASNLQGRCPTLFC